jgi:hypothetical protein
MTRCGIPVEYLDLWTALTSGLVWQQIANEPGGDRWARLVDDVVDMFLAHVEAHKNVNKRRKRRGAA